MILEFLKAFTTLIVIMDPFGGIPIFLSLTKGYSLERMRFSATRAIKVSLLLVLLFIFLGEGLLNFFNISFSSFQIGGGVILLILGISYVLDFAFASIESKDYTKDITIPLATPLIVGSGVFTYLILLVRETGYLTVTLASFAALFVFWILMRYANIIKAFIGEQGLEILSKIMGMLIVAIAVELIVNGIKILF